MQIRNTLQRYGAIAQLLHWIMAILIIGMVVLGLYMEDLPITDKVPGQFGYTLYQLHKSIGFVVLTLAVLRILWRFVGPTPPVPEGHGALLKLAAHATHWLLYGLIFAMPISGWLYVSADSLSHSMVPTRFFNLFVIPNLLDADDDVRNFFRGMHGLLSNVLIAVVALHVAAALGHHVLFRDNVLLRMLPFAKLRSQ